MEYRIVRYNVIIFICYVQKYMKIYFFKQLVFFKENNKYIKIFEFCIDIFSFQDVDYFGFFGREFSDEVVVLDVKVFIIIIGQRYRGTYLVVGGIFVIYGIVQIFLNFIVKDIDKFLGFFFQVDIVVIFFMQDF